MPHPVEYRQGNLFTAEEGLALAHGCNCQGVMGAGIALQFQRCYPLMYNEYTSRCKSGIFLPGTVMGWSPCLETGGRLILNLATQDYPGPRARLEWIEAALMCAIETHPGIIGIAMPRIGAGFGGLDWEDVRQVIEKVAMTTEVKLIVYSL